MVLNTKGGKTSKLMESIVHIFGFKFTQSLQEINLSSLNPFPFSFLFSF